MNAGPPWKSKDKHETESLAAVPCLVDHDGDGDLDLYIGNISGRVIHIENKGTAKKFSFDASTRTTVMAAGQPVKVEGDAGPLAADWDGDGRIDLLVGSGDGSVWWYRNEGKKGEPAYAAGVTLLPKSGLNWEKPIEHGGAPTGPGVRAKVGVADWNGDGRLDLLVGDFWQEKAAAKPLTDSQKARLAELKKRLRELESSSAADPKDEMTKVYEEIETLEPNPTMRGSVWLYLRQNGKPTAAK